MREYELTELTSVQRGFRADFEAHVPQGRAVGSRRGCEPDHDVQVSKVLRTFEVETRNTLCRKQRCARVRMSACELCVRWVWAFVRGEDAAEARENVAPEAVGDRLGEQGVIDEIRENPLSGSELELCLLSKFSGEPSPVFDHCWLVTAALPKGSIARAWLCRA